MSTKLFNTTILILSLCGSVTQARIPMGPPIASLEKGKWSIGFNASTTETDLEFHNIKGTTFFTTDKANDFEFESIMGKLAYGINDNWEVSVAFGASEAKYQEVRSWMDGMSLETLGTEFKSDTGFITEIGTKVTLYEDGPLGIGASFQVNWAKLDGKYSEATWTNGIFNDSGGGELDTDIMVFQFAPGISYELFGSFNLYCGPLWQWIDGEGDATGLNGSLTGKDGEGDITEDSSFGGLIGFNLNIGSDATANFEWNATGSSDTFAFSLTKKF
ncbi:MAG: hypothetical protein ACYTFW_18240 [Planctomycetota bacterium]|jgi:hypothetical protein